MCERRRWQRELPASKSSIALGSMSITSAALRVWAARKFSDVPRCKRFFSKGADNTEKHGNIGQQENERQPQQTIHAGFAVLPHTHEGQGVKSDLHCEKCGK